MFNKDFYPTPKAVIEQMLFNVDIANKVVLEPSAGNGNIVDHLRANSAKEVLACELNPDLAKIAAQKADRLICSDFLKLTKEEISHIDLIVMNPPFSADEKHILHAWDIAPGGCEIVALCNWETLDNRFTRMRTELHDIVKANGGKENLGDVFSDADRKTDVEIGLIHLFKPATGEEEFDGYFDLSEQYEYQEEGLMGYNSIRDKVNRYVGAVKMFDDVQTSAEAINELVEPIQKGYGIKFEARSNEHEKRYLKITREVYKKELQKSAWKTIFSEMKMDKYVTSKVKENINKFVEKQTHVPFTMNNIFKMIEIIVGTHQSRMDQVLVEAFDRICSFSHKNSTAGEGWKTNSDYKVNKRFIHPHICEYDHRWGGGAVNISLHYRDSIDDIVKALCYLTGKDFNEVSFISDSEGYKLHNHLYAFCNREEVIWGEWVQWNEFFKVRGYKKGTMHFEFIDENVWMEFNRRVAKIKGWVLPEKTDRKKKGTERTKQNQMEIF